MQIRQLKYLFLLYLIPSVYTLVSAEEPDYFSGVIRYEINYAQNSGFVDYSKYYENLYGTEMHYFINDRYYKTTDSLGKLVSLFHSQSNLFYFITENEGSTDTAVLDASKYQDEIVHISHLPVEVNINGHKCKMIIIETENKVTSYFYDPEIKVNTIHFQDHKLGNWATYLKETNGALPIRYKIEKKNYHLEVNALEIIHQDLADSEFRIGIEETELIND